MHVIAFIHDEDVIRKILKHLNLWDVKHKTPARLPVRGTQTGAHAPPIDFHNTYNESPMPSVDDQLIDIEYPIEAYF